MTDFSGVTEGRQWLRQCSLVVSSTSGDGLELASLRVKFKTRQGDIETPNSAEIAVYNLSDATMSKMRKEFTQVILQAGYPGNCALIFSGSIRQARSFREGGTDTVLELLCADGDAAYNFATVNSTLAAGSTPANHLAVCGKAMEGHGVQTGYAPDPGGAQLPRGKVMYGMARKYLRDTARATNTDWSIQNGRLTVVPRTGYLPGEAVVLTAETGLVSMPEQTNEGIRVRCLLNPRLRVGGRIKLDNASVKAARTELKDTLGGVFRHRLDRDGLYRIIRIEFSGDTRGTEWYADILAIGLDDTVNLPLDQMEA